MWSLQWKGRTITMQTYGNQMSAKHEIRKRWYGAAHSSSAKNRVKQNQRCFLDASERLESLYEPSVVHDNSLMHILQSPRSVLSFC